MSLRILLALIVTLLIASCTNLPSDNQGGGGGGIGGTAGTGGTGGTAGSGGTDGVGGSGATGIDPCSDIILDAAADTEANDRFEEGVATGTVCSGGACEDGVDDQDLWSMDVCDGRHRIKLTWTFDASSNLDLALFGQGDIDPLGESNDPTGTEEEIVLPLETTETYTIVITATDTAGARRDYDLTVEYLP